MKRSSALFFIILWSIIINCKEPEPVAEEGDTTGPTAPSSLTAAINDLTSLDLAWVGSTDNMGVTGYKVFDNNSEIGTVTTTMFRHEGLVAGSEHCYRVKAFDLAGNVSDPSSEVCVTLASGGNCQSGYHDDGNGQCVATGTCAIGFHDDGSGTCVVDIPTTGWIQTGLNAGMGRGLYATDAEIFAATSDGVYSTIDNTAWLSKGLKNTDVSDIIKSNESILAATISGVYRSLDGGNTWLPTTGSPGVSSHPHVFAKNSSYVFVIAWAQGVFRSGDDGANWEQVHVGHQGYGYQDYGAGATCIITIGEKVFIGGTSPSPIYSSSSNGDTDTWVGSAGPTDILTFYNDNGRLFAGGMMGVYLSTDLGDSWSTQYTATIGEYGETIGFTIFRNIISYNQKLIATIDFNSIYISSDDGMNWTSFSDGLIPDWSFSAVAIKPPYIWALRDFFGNAYRRLLTEM